MVKSTGLFTPLHRSKHYTTRQLCWHDDIYQHLNKHKAGNNFHVWIVGVFERSLKQSYLLPWKSVQEASFFFFPYLNVFMAEARPGQPGKQFTMMCKVVTFSNKSGYSIIPPVLIALSGVWHVIASTQSPTSAGGEQVLPKWESVQVWSWWQTPAFILTVSRSSFLSQRRGALGRLACYHCNASSFHVTSIARSVLSGNQSNWFLSTSVEISGAMCNLV